MITQVMANIYPPVKLIWMLTLNLFALNTTNHYVLITILIVDLMILLVSGKKVLLSLLQSWRTIVLLPILLSSFHIVLQPGLPVVDLSFVTVTTEGLLLGSIYFLRFFSALTAVAIVLATTDLRDLVVSLTDLGLSDRATLALFLALRYVPLLTDKARSIREAQVLRNVSESNNKILKYVFKQKRYVTTLVIAAVRMANITANALDTRGFGIVARRSYYKKPVFKYVHLSLLCTLSLPLYMMYTV